jgi:hypothetical protein
MIKDAVGNEIKVGDKILVQVQGLSCVEVIHISEGGLAVNIPGMGNAITKGVIKIKLEQDIPFEPRQNLPFYVINVPEKENGNNLDGKEKKEHGPN